MPAPKIEYQVLKVLNGESYDLDLTSVYHSVSQNPKFPADQLQLRGRSGGVAVKVYVPLECLDMLTKLGALEHPIAGNKDNYGSQKYVMRGKPSLSIIRQKNGWVDLYPQGGAVPQGVQKAPAVAPKPPQAPNGQPKALRPIVPAPALIGEPWKEMDALYERCVLMAIAVWKRSGVVLNGPEVVAAAAALFIEANRKGLRVEEPKPPKATPPRKAPAQNAGDALEMPERMRDDMDAELVAPWEE